MNYEENADKTTRGEIQEGNKDTIKEKKNSETFQQKQHGLTSIFQKHYYVMTISKNQGLEGKECSKYMADTCYDNS